MRILVIEDEAPNARHLISLLQRLDPAFQIEGPLVSISEALEWLSNHPMPELILLDIQLADGLSFELFEEIPISTPIIFTTAYHQYTIKAFEVNSIDYLLKPIQAEQLSKAITKFKSLYQRPAFNSNTAQQLLQMLSGVKTRYKRRFLIRSGNKSVVVPTQEVAVFHKDEVTLLLTSAGKKYAINYPLEELQQMLPPDDFFRISRQSIVNAAFIHSIRPSGNQLQLKLHIDLPWPLWVSQRNTAAFKQWLNDD